ncbi:MAG: helix-turn-helix transcriptional regulator [Ruminococcus bromii]|nr:helix-turn-helix transcriptional regulator [Ruminococcus bromii]
MEFNEKLQELRKQKGLTQEELAEILFVSRTAVSKWESGRGMPSIESLKAISKFFAVTLDDLLSSEELLVIAEDDHKQKEMHIRDMIYGLLDCSIALLFLLPFFGQKANGVIQEVSLLVLTEIQLYLKILYLVIVLGMTVLGILTLVLRNCNCAFWIQNKSKVSLLFNAIGVFLFIISQQPYAAVFVFSFLIIKALMLIKR